MRAHDCWECGCVGAGRAAFCIIAAFAGGLIFGALIYHQFLHP